MEQPCQVSNKKKGAKEKEQEKEKTAAELERRDIKLVLANLWTVGMLMLTMFDPKGQHMMSRCCKMDNTRYYPMKRRKELVLVTCSVQG